MESPDVADIPDEPEKLVPFEDDVGVVDILSYDPVLRDIKRFPLHWMAHLIPIY